MFTWRLATQAEGKPVILGHLRTVSSWYKVGMKWNVFAMPWPRTRGILNVAARIKPIPLSRSSHPVQNGWHPSSSSSSCSGPPASRYRSQYGGGSCVVTASRDTGWGACAWAGTCTGTSDSMLVLSPISSTLAMNLTPKSRLPVIDIREVVAESGRVMLFFGSCTVL